MKRVAGKLIWSVTAVAAVVAIVYGFIPEPIKVDYITPANKRLEITVNDDGETRIRERYIVSAPVTGKLLRIQLHAGDEVQRAETELAQIKPSDPKLLDVRSRAEAQARARTAQAAIMQAEAAVAESKESAELAKNHHDRAKLLLAKNAISKADFDAAEFRERIVRAQLRSAEFAVRVATYELDQANAALQYTLPAESDDFDATTFKIRSPIDGRVLNVLNEDAQVIQTGMPLMELGDPKDMELKVDVLSTEAVRIRPGNKVHIEHWGGAGALSGTVRLVEPSAFLKISALGVEEKRVNVIIDFDDPWQSRETLGDGFRVEARIVVDATEEDALIVPAGTLFRDAEKWNVFRVVDGRAVQTIVEVGRSNGIETEIRGGLTADDTVIEHPPDNVLDGVKVEPIQR